MANPIALYDDNVSIRDVGNFIFEFKARQNVFCDALVNRIGMVLVTSKLWNNPLARYKKGMLELGETVEEIFVEMGKAFSYDPQEAEETWMRRELPDVRAAYHTMNYQKFYKVTVQRNDLRQAFLSWDSIDSLVAKIVESLYKALNYDEFVSIKFLIARYMLNGHMKMITVPKPDTKEALETVIKNVKAEADNLTFLKPDYNQAGVFNSAEKSEQYVWITTELNAATDVDVLAKAYNMDRTEFVGHLEVIDTLVPNAVEEARLATLYPDLADGDGRIFTDAEKAKLAEVVLFVITSDFLMIFDNLNEADQARNPEGMYWQYWVHAWRTYSVSPFAPAYALTTTSPTVTSVTVSPATANVAQGTAMQFTAAVETRGMVDADVAWSIALKTPVEDATELESGTAIDPSSGYLRVATTEPVGTVIQVTASKGGKTATADVTVVAR